ncbi:DUF4402 domain-containing protein [Niastella populi]|uniref:DUF4402 domain-containing protein n=1 Tax=Niastella populi TaxID=550983 RepID=A0A1V9EJU6_9BACT|nr:DUF4402 domain-containing protein [Niastella populi]OQP46420.1 hypothetical protein A4R26_31975 [Niastella populi]
MSAKLKLLKRKRLLLMIGSCMYLLLTGFSATAQISVNTLQNLSFGAFSHGNSGGTVVIAANGARSVTGDVIPVNLGFQYYPAIFEVEAPSGTIINIVNGPDVQLTGSNGGSMTLHIGASDPASPFTSTTTPPAKNSIKVGATLTVGGPAANPPGVYSGSFSVTFIQE